MESLLKQIAKQYYYYEDKWLKDGRDKRDITDFTRADVLNLSMSNKGFGRFLSTFAGYIYNPDYVEEFLVQALDDLNVLDYFIVD